MPLPKNTPTGSHSFMRISGLLRPEPVQQGSELSPRQEAVLTDAVLNLFERWKLSDKEARTLLGDITPATWSRWKKSRKFNRIGPDLRKRMANLIDIHFGLRKMFREPERGYNWIKNPRDEFKGMSALDVMLRGDLDDLAFIRDWVNADIGMG